MTTRREGESGAAFQLRQRQEAAANAAPDLFASPGEVAAHHEGEVPPHQPQSTTSRAAAESVRHMTKGRMDRVLSLIRERPQTDQELHRFFLKQTDDLGMHTLTTVQSIRVKLRSEGYIRDSGRVRMNPSARKATIWEVNLTTDPDPKPPTKKELQERIDVLEAAIKRLRGATVRAARSGTHRLLIPGHLGLEIEEIVDAIGEEDWYR